MKFEQILASNTVGVERHRRTFEVCLLKERALGFEKDLRRIGVGFVSDLDAFGGICRLVCVKSHGEMTKTMGFVSPHLPLI